MAHAFRKDIWRTIVQSRKRFISILIICVLGVTMVTGLRASCFDLRNSTDAFFDSQQLYDVSIQSTLGLSADDVEAVSKIDGVQQAEGTWTEDTYTDAGSSRLSVEVKVLSESGINEPYLVSGELPTTSNEIAVTQNYLDVSGASIGDTVTLEDNGSDALFMRTEYTITGTVIDPTELTNPTGPIAIRASASPDCCFFVTADAVDPEVADTFTTIYIKAANADGISSYSDQYTSLINTVVDNLETLRTEREQARTDEIKQDAQATIDEQEAEAQDGFTEAESQLADAQAQIDDGWEELIASKSQLAEGRQQLADGEAELEAQAQQLKEGRAQIEEGLNQVTEGRTQIESGIQQINAACDAQIEDAQAALDQGLIDENTYRAMLQVIEQERANQLAPLDEQLKTLETTEQQLSTQLSQITEGETALASARQ